ncbi:30S ribosomal protein S4 [Candidatus Woesearchaeota archaeon]|nr:30S ribosomal protein S4 [Candidatus Woesearchaeota archaeon]
MGQTKKLRKKYETPAHPWLKDRILQEKEYVKEYGFKNKKEIWKEVYKLKKSRDQAKKIIANSSADQSQKEKEQLINRLLKYGLTKHDSKIEDVLALKASDFFERRLQTLVFKKGLSKSVNQARQFIVHGHVFIGDRKITAPSYMVSLEEESKIMFNPRSNLSKEDHPERVILTKQDKKILEEIKPKQHGKKEEVVEEKIEEVSVEE